MRWFYSKFAIMIYDNLKGKTIFDFCTDTKVLGGLTDFSKAEYIALVKDNHFVVVRDLLDLAAETNNKQLERAVARQYPKETEQYRNFFNE